jgi:hypothetical protein
MRLQQVITSLEETIAQNSLLVAKLVGALVFAWMENLFVRMRALVLVVSTHTLNVFLTPNFYYFKFINNKN